MKNLSILFALCALQSCYVPPQNFQEGSASYIAANPEVKNLESYANNKHEVNIAVLDAGIDYNNTNFQKNLKKITWKGKVGVGLDVLGDDLLPSFMIVDPKTSEPVAPEMMDSDHGTHVSSLATLGGYLYPRGKKISAKEKMGLIPVRVLPMVKEYKAEEATDEFLADFMNLYKVENEMMTQVLDHLSAGIEFASQQGADIVNMSLYMNLEDITIDILREQFKMDLYNRLIVPAHTTWKNMLFVVATGNSSLELNSIENSIPATLDIKNMIRVGALDSKKEIAKYSNYGKYADIYINGSDINAMTSSNQRTKLSGTSMASPLIANLAAKIKLILPNATPLEIRDIILSTAQTKVLPTKEEKRVLTIRVANFKAALEKAYAQLR